MSLIITVLLENKKIKNIENILIAKNGLSLLIQDGKNNILFDTGPDSSFIKNAKSLGIDISKIDTVIISHGHYDHCGGVPYLPKGSNIICHPGVNNIRYSYLRAFGHIKKIKKLSLDIDYSSFSMQYHSHYLNINDDFLWSGEIHVNNPDSYGVIGNGKPDYIIDEGVLIYKSTSGLIIIIGCAHRGLINIIKHCQKITGVKKIHAIIGGFHLRCASIITLLKLKHFLNQEQPDFIIGGHCTGRWARLWLPKILPLATGQRLEFS